jgi:hypothetical protein
MLRVSSVTYAIRAQKQLERYGIRSAIKKLAANLSVTGCGYALEVQGDITAAADIIRAAGIRILAAE